MSTAATLGGAWGNCRHMTTTLEVFLFWLDLLHINALLSICRFCVVDGTFWSSFELSFEINPESSKPSELV